MNKSVFRTVVRSSDDDFEQHVTSMSDMQREQMRDIRQWYKSGGAISTYRDDQGGALILLLHRPSEGPESIAEKLKAAAADVSLKLVKPDSSYAVYVTQELVSIRVDGIRTGEAVKVVNGTAVLDTVFSIMAPKVLLSYVSDAQPQWITRLDEDDDSGAKQPHRTSTTASAPSSSSAKANQGYVANANDRGASRHSDGLRVTSPSTSTNQNDFWKAVNM